MRREYPRCVINLNHLEDNVRAAIRRCNHVGIDVTGVIKGANGAPEVAKAYVEGGIGSLATSRLEQIETLIAAGIKVPLTLVRIPMMSEVDDVVRLTDTSLNTEPTVLRALNEAAAKQEKIHNVILMHDVGDLREGFWDVKEAVDTALLIEKELKNLYLQGVGTNVGCYGSVEPTVETLEKLVVVAKEIEAAIGRKLDIVSGGASSSLMRVWDEDMPEGINHLRLGGEMMLAYTNQMVYGYDMSEFHRDTFRLDAEIEEIKMKPSEGGTMRKYAVLNVGTSDYCNVTSIMPQDESIHLVASYDDCTVFDVQDSPIHYNVGDIVSFDLRYGAMCYLTRGGDVKIEFI